MNLFLQPSRVPETCESKQLLAIEISKLCKSIYEGMEKGLERGSVEQMVLLAIEMYKAANNISPSAIADFLPNKVIYHETRNKCNFTREKVNSIHYGAESLRILGPKLWDHLPSEIKSAQSLLLFKSKNKKWSVQNCPYRLCKTYVPNLGFL